MTVALKQNVAGYTDEQGRFRPIRSPEYVGGRTATRKDKRKYSPAKAGDLGKAKQERALEDVFDREIRLKKEAAEQRTRDEKRIMAEIEGDVYGGESRGKGQSLLQFVRNAGGFRRQFRHGGKKAFGKRSQWDGGEIDRLSYKETGKRGLTTDQPNKGKTPDKMYQAALAEGFEVSSISDLMERVESEAAGHGATYSTHGSMNYTERENPKRRTATELQKMQLTAQYAQTASQAASQKFGHGSTKHLAALRAWKTASQRYHRAKAKAKTNPEKVDWGMRVCANCDKYVPNAEITKLGAINVCKPCRKKLTAQTAAKSQRALFDDQGNLFNPAKTNHSQFAKFLEIRGWKALAKEVRAGGDIRKAVGVIYKSEPKAIQAKLDHLLTLLRKPNPDVVSTFAQLAAGISSALSIHERLAKPTKRKATKKRGTTTAKRRNPAVTTKRVVKNRNRNLYALTIGSGDDIISVLLKDKDGDGFSKEFKTMASAKAYATRNKHKVEWNPAPVKIVRKRNVDGFVDHNGVFHPIRHSEDYSPAMAGERGQSKRKAASTVKSRFKKAATKKKSITKHRATPAKRKANPTPRLTADQKIFIRAMTEPQLEHTVDAWSQAKINGIAKALDKKGLLTSFGTLTSAGYAAATQLRIQARKNPTPKKNGVISRALARRKAASEYKKELRLEAAAERSRQRRRKAEAKAKANPKTARPVKHSQRRPAYESFQGRPSEKVYTEVPISNHAPAKLDQLGDLIELKIAGGPTLKFNGKGVRLCTAGGKLWIAGKRFAKPNPGTAANVVNPIGEIDHVVYGTSKPHHGDHNYTHYIHKLGEESGKRPILCVDREGYPVIRGGNYKIEARGIVD